ncbi:hypothetical protein [Flavobacterium sp.]|uniref:hypothetical protein n=1 Tax=Flavobacterium sp. TaxID=239 RepID=UPI00286A5AFB|nr:hypothetical protein [Flavobacterium sp.]
MENNTSTIEKLIEKAEVYGKTSLELLQCKLVYKSTDIAGVLVVKLLLGIVFMMALFLVNIGASLLIGSFLEESYYGFFVVAIFYVILGLFIYALQYSLIKKPVSDFIIKSSLN